MDSWHGYSSHAIGIALLLLVVALWTVSAFLTESILVHETDTYTKPFLITWLCTASFSLYLVPLAVASVIRTAGHPRAAVGSKPEETIYDAVPAADVLDAHPDDGVRSAPPLSLPPLTLRATAVLAAQFCVLWFAANYAMNAALSLTTVSSMTVLSATSGLFTLVIGRLARVEVFSLSKLGAVFLSIVGVAMVSESDNSVAPAASAAASRGHLRLFGDALALTSAFLYGCYVIFLKLRIGTESRISMPLFFGFVGIFNVVLLWPFAVLLHLTGIETVERPPSARIWWSLIVNALITFISDYLYIIAMLKTSPLLVTVGLSLTIPAAVTGDLVQGTPVGNMVLFIAGALLVVCAFVVVGVSGSTESPGTPLLQEEPVLQDVDAG